jgi:hypothetical protein
MNTLPNASTYEDFAYHVDMLLDFSRDTTTTTTTPTKDEVGKQSLPTPPSLSRSMSRRDLRSIRKLASTDRSSLEFALQGGGHSEAFAASIQGGRSTRVLGGKAAFMDRRQSTPNLLRTKY